MYIHDTSPQIQLAGLGKFKLKKLFKAPAKIVRAVVKAPAKVVRAVAKPAKKIVKQTAKVIKKVAPIALAAGAAYYAPQLLPAILARRRAAGGEAPPPPMDEFGTPLPPGITSQDALSTAARAYYASRLPRPMPSQPSPYSEADEADYAQPAGPAPLGAALGNLKVPLIAAAIGIPLLVIATRPPERRR